MRITIRWPRIIIQSQRSPYWYSKKCWIKLEAVAAILDFLAWFSPRFVVFLCLNEWLLGYTTLGKEFHVFERTVEYPLNIIPPESWPHWWFSTVDLACCVGMQWEHVRINVGTWWCRCGQLNQAKLLQIHSWTYLVTSRDRLDTGEMPLTQEA